MPAKLSVNLNAIAMLRNRRDLPWPSVEGIGRIALAAGAHGLTVHPRPDERHTRHADLPILRALIDDEFPEAEFNIEGYPSEDFLRLVEKSQPNQVTLVPDDPAQATSDHGWDFVRQARLSGADRAAPEEGRLPRFAVCRSRSGRHGRRRATPAQTASSSTRDRTALATMIRQRPPSNWKSWEKRPMRRSPPGLPSMPATISRSPICRRLAAASPALPRSRSDMA